MSDGGPIGTGFLMHRAAALHDPGWGHPEHQGRLRALVSAVHQDTPTLLDRVQSIEGIAAAEEDVARVHAVSLLRRLKDASDSAGEGAVPVDATGETRVSAATWDAALGSAGSVLQACRLVADGELRNAFVAARPPGHHATTTEAMGFCFINSVAVAAAAIRADGVTDRVLIVDWDVHHGNGTQDIFYWEPDVFYLSFHQVPSWPGTGAAGETGAGPGVGATRNVGFSPRTPRSEYVSRCRREIREVAAAFRPGFILVSAGYDALAADPLADQLLEPADFGALSEEVAAVAEEHCDGRLVVALEGGYAPKETARAVVRTVRALAGVGAEE